MADVDTLDNIPLAKRPRLNGDHVDDMEMPPPTSEHHASSPQPDQFTEPGQESASEEQGQRRAGFRDIHEEELGGRKYRPIRKGEQVSGNHDQYANLITFSFKRDTESFRPKFNFIIFDESQRLKGADTNLTRSVTLLDCESLVFVTSTPLFSAVYDLISTLRLMWKRLGFDCVFPDTIGDPAQLYQLDYDPNREMLVENDVVTRTPGLFHVMDDGPALHAFKAAWEKEKIALWMLSPRLFTATGSRMNWSVDFGRKVVRPLLKTIMIRWSRTSRLKLPDGTVEYPGVGIPPVNNVTEELCHGPSRHAEVKDHFWNLMKSLHSFGQSNNSAPSYMPSDAPGSSIRVNGETFRQGVFHAFDPRFTTLFSPEIDNLTRERDIQRARTGYIVHNTLNQGLTENWRSSTSNRTIGGLRKVEDLIEHDMLGGLMYWFDSTKESDAMTCPVLRHEMLRWFLRTNPIMTRLMHHVVEKVLKGRHRIVVYVQYPLIQQ